MTQPDCSFVFTMTINGIESDWEIFVTKTLSHPLGWRVDCFEGLDVFEEVIFIDGTHSKWRFILAEFRGTDVFEIIDEKMRD